MEWDTVIGLEVHAQLKTKSKLFSGASTAYGAEPNTQTAYIDAGFPGVLPVLNQEAIVMAIQFGLSIGADINDLSVFERKNYFYPDLPKGYQISQLQKPIVSQGQLKITLKDKSLKEVQILRAHLEEDAGKSIHKPHSVFSEIDLNRAGIPLLEIVTTPCLFSAEEAITYLKTLHQLLRFLGICDGNMQEGSFRADVNISLKPAGSKILGTRTELKNLNSFRFIEKAIAYECKRHQELLENNIKIKQETRLYNADNDTTYAMREKEFENDYRYFPDPDLLPIQVTRYQIAKIKSNLPELPEQIHSALKNIPSLNEEDILFILSSPAAYCFYKELKALSKASEKLIINWLKGPYSASLNENHLTFESPIIPADVMAKFLDKLQDKSLSTNQAKTVFAILWKQEENLETIINKQSVDGLTNDQELEAMISQLLHDYPTQAEELKLGKEKLLGFFVGKIMQLTKGQADPEAVGYRLKQMMA